MGGLVWYLLRSWKSWSAFGVHSNGPVFFISLKKGRARSPSFEMKRTNEVTLPTSFYISLRVYGGLMSSMSFTFFGLASIPLWDTRKSSSLPEGTPNTHFSRLSRKSTWRRLSKVYSRCRIEVSASRDFTTMSST